MKERISKGKKEYLYKFSVIVLTYNTSFEKLKVTIDSIIKQKFDSFQLIISDDGTDAIWEDRICEYLKKNRFKNYVIRKNQKNIGTVKHCAVVLKIADGKYVKAIGAGDYLYDENTLAKMYNFLEDNNYSIAFGKLEKYHKKNGVKVELGQFVAPRNMCLYQNRHWYLRSQLNILVLHDWISGAAIFARTSVLLYYINMIKNVSKYCDDMFQICVFAERQQIYFMNEYVMYYEYGTGVSTGNKKYRKALIADNDNTIRFAIHKYKSNFIYTTLLRLGQMNNSYGMIIKRLIKKYIVG